MSPRTGKHPLTAVAIALTPALAARAEDPRCTPFALDRVERGMAIVAIDEGALRAAADAAGAPRPFIIADVPAGPGRVLDLRVQRLRVARAGTRFEFVASPQGPAQPIDFDPESVLLLAGAVPGHPASHVFLAVSSGSATGTIELGPGAPTYLITPRAEGGRRLPAGQALSFEARPQEGGERPPTLCGYQGGAPIAPYLAAAGAARFGRQFPESGPEPIRGLKQVQLAVDADYEYFSLFPDLNGASEYIVTLYGAISAMYIRDTRARIDLSYVRIWTTPNDPWGTLAGMPQTFTFPPGTVWDIAQTLSGSRLAGEGGAASGLTSYTAYTQGFFVTPDAPHIYNQDLDIPAHEIGHTLGGPHTHDIGIDTCHIATSPPRRGTVLSYCAQVFSGGRALHDIRLHTQIQQLIRSTINSRPGVVNDCNQNAIGDALDISSGFSPDANTNGIPDECEDCNRNGVLDNIDILTGVSLDQNANGMPDECEPDCNANNVPDDRDILLGTSQDLHGNGVPDECEADCNANGQPDYNEIMANMALDLDRNAVLDACQDCDADGVPDFIELEGANDAWVASVTQGVIRRYHAWSGVFVQAGTGTTLQQPQDLRITPDRRILVSSAGDDRIAEFSSAGTFVGNLVPPGTGGLDFPTGMTFAPGGSLLVCSAMSSSVLRFDAGNGAFLGVFVPSGSGGLVSPFGIGFGPAGTLLVTSSNNQVLEFDGRTGAFIRVLVASAANGSLMNPRGLLVLDDPPRLIVASRTNERILEYNPATGAFVRQFNIGDYHGNLDGPWALRVGPNGNVFASVADALEAGPVSALHLIDPRVFEFAVKNGDLRRAYILGMDSLASASGGFDFMPGTGRDCNWNQIPDTCDISSGFSQDQNGNGVPDECETCYPDCNADAALTIADFACFQTKFVAQDPYADCNGAGGFTIADFGCFQTKFVAGCP